MKSVVRIGGKAISKQYEFLLDEDDPRTAIEEYNNQMLTIFSTLLRFIKNGKLPQWAFKDR